MYRNNLLALSTTALLCLGVAFSSTDALAQQKTLRDQLVGAWTLVSLELSYPDGKKRYEYGPKPYGVLILDASGYYAIVQGDPNRPKVKASGDVRSVTAATELGEAAFAFGANFGTWSVDEAANLLIRKYEGALIPNNDGLVNKASVSVSGEGLTLSQTHPSGDRTDSVFRRAK
jgi:hypothetical protein